MDKALNNKFKSNWITIREEDNFDRIAEWLKAESDDIRAHVDGGDFGSPISAESVCHHIEAIRNGTKQGSVGTYKTVRSFFGYLKLDTEDDKEDYGSTDTVCIGHVAMGRYDPSEDASNNITSFNKGDRCHVLYMYVPTTFRGKGYGTELLKKAIMEAKNDKNNNKIVSSFSILVHPENTRAKKFYSNCGFEKTERTYEKPKGAMELWLSR